MKILALEFSSPQRSVAVLDSKTGATAEAIDTGHGHTMKPFGLIAETLRQVRLEREQIEVIVVGLGPGSYTGIRAAIALAQGWRLARGVKLCGISSVQCLASQEAAEGLTKFNVVIDAQRSEFYLATYGVSAQGDLTPISPLQIVGLEVIKERENAGEIMVGPDVAKWFAKGRRVFPRAAALAQLRSMGGGLVSADQLEPIYLRETTFVKTSSGYWGNS